MRRRRENANERLEEPDEAVLRFHRSERRHRRLPADQTLHFGYDVDDDLRLIAERLAHGGAPQLDPRRFLGRDVRDQFAERLAQGAVGRPAGELLELSSQEKSASGRNRAAQLLDQRRLAAAGRSCDEHQFGLCRRDPLERRLQRGGLLVATVEAIRETEQGRRVVLRQRKRRERRAGGELGSTVEQIGDQSAGALVSIVRHFREQFEHNRRDRLRHRGPHRRRKDRRFREVVVNERQRIVGGERGNAGEQVKQRRAERVEVRPEVDRVADPPRFFGWRIGQRPQMSGRGS